jgi:hypothetical protein
MRAHSHLLGRETPPQKTTKRATEGIPYALVINKVPLEFPAWTTVFHYIRA